jgi:hypothetical protein
MGVNSATSRARPRFSRASALAATTSLLLCLLFGATAARADTTFGGDPTQAITPGISCQLGAPTGIGVYPGTAGSPSCMWGWSSPGVGTDIVPLPVGGGSGTITSVTLPAMPNPGPMQVVVLTAALAASTVPSKPDYVCCQVKQVGPTFTVPPNQVTTVPQALAVSATEEANLSQPGDTSFGDLLGISVLSPSASLPLRYTGNSGLSGGPFDGDYAYYPAPAGPNGEYATPYNITGFQMLASFTLGAAAGAGPAPAPAGAPAGAKGGLKLAGKPLRVGADGKTLTLGRATNPPTAATTQTLTAPAAARASAAVSAKGKRKQLVLGRGATKVAAGKSAAIKLRLTGTGRAQLRKQGTLRATLTIVATNPQGEKQTVTRGLTVKPAPPKSKPKK